jgi:hypothetical protein
LVEAASLSMGVIRGNEPQVASPQDQEDQEVQCPLLMLLQQLLLLLLQQQGQVAMLL